jgi:hypothetical protein
MGSLMLYAVPVLFALLGLMALLGKSGASAASPGAVLRLVWRLVRYLWRPRHPYGGAARAERPGLRYRPPRGDEG